MPRVRYKPQSWYEEAVGLRNAKRIAYAVMTFMMCGYMTFLIAVKTINNVDQSESEEGIEKRRAKVTQISEANEAMTRMLSGEERRLSTRRRNAYGSGAEA